MRIVCIIALSLATLFTGCADHVTDNDNLGVSTNPLTENGPEAIGLLTFLNHPETTLDVLDHKVPLNRRAARNLIHHRDGWDKEPGTFDDNLFDTVAEVDAVPWIGPATMERLVHYVLAEGWVPQGDDILGVWDGVSFTVKEAQRTLDFVNKASHDLLDDGLRLDKRAADSIMEAQPIESIGELADLYYVGGSALKRLKQTANETAGTVYQDQFNHDEVEEIPDASGAGVDTNVHVVGVPDIMVDVVAKIHLMHDAPEEVQLKLRSPNGSTWSINAKGPATTLPIGPMAKPNGLWSLNAVDPVKGNIGELYGWAIEVQNSGVGPSAESVFASDVAKAIVAWYDIYATDAAAMGGNTLTEALALVSAEAVTEIIDADDAPYAHDLSTTLVLSHPDVIFPGGDLVWFGAYERDSMNLIEVYTFE